MIHKATRSVPQTQLELQSGSDPLVPKIMQILRGLGRGGRARHDINQSHRRGREHDEQIR